MRRLIIFTFLCCASGHAPAQDATRKTIWDLELGAPVYAQPSAIEYRGYACGANGGPPRQQLTNFGDFMRCAADANGLHEVYFEYDDEVEYIARARDLELEINRFAGTAENGYAIAASALFDDAGVLRGLRIVTDPRADYRKDVTNADASKRADAYQLGGVMANRFAIDPKDDCKSMSAAQGESAVGSVFIKLDCEKIVAAENRRYALSVRLLRKPGQRDRDPRVPSQLTNGQFESSARLDIYWVERSP